MKNRIASYSLCTTLLVSCGGGGGGEDELSEVSGGSQSLNLSGQWAGSGADDSGTGTIRFRNVTQIENKVRSEIEIQETGDQNSEIGLFEGTINGTTLIFTITIPQYQSPLSACSSFFRGQAKNVTASRIYATYTGAIQCSGVSGGVSGGDFTLTKL